MKRIIRIPDIVLKKMLIIFEFYANISPQFELVRGHGAGSSDTGML